MLLRLVTVLGLVIALVSGVVAAQETALDVDTAIELATDVGYISLSVPEDWYVEVYSETNAVAVNAPHVFSKTVEDKFFAYEAWISAYTYRFASFVDAAGLSEEETVRAILNYLIEPVDTTGAQPETLAVTIRDGVPVATIKTRVPESASYVMVRLVSDNTYLFVEVITAPDALDDWTELAEAMLDSMTFAEHNTPATAASAALPPLDATYSADKIAFTVDYPSGWVTRPSFPNGVAVGTSEAALDLWFSHAFGPDDAHAFIGYGTLEEMFDLSFTSPLTPLEIFEISIEAEPADGELILDGPYETTINGKDAAYLSLIQPESATYMLLVDYGGGHVLSTQIQTGVDSLEAMSALLMAMVETVTVAPAAD